MNKTGKGQFKKGNPGRKKGSLNKFTTLNQAYLDAFNSEELGSTQGLIDAFKVNLVTRRDFYKIISKMLPSSVGIDGNIKHEHRLSIADLKKSMKEYDGNGSDK